MFRVALPLTLKKLETISRNKVFCMLIAKGKISRRMIFLLSTWRHSGFHVFWRDRIQQKEENAMENLASYIIRASFPGNGCSTWIRRGRSSILPKTARKARASPPWSGAAGQPVFPHAEQGLADGAVLKDW